MEKKINLARKIWRKLLKVYYKNENAILSDPSKLEKFIRIVSLMPIHNNKVLFDNFSGKGYGENPKYICEELLKRSNRYNLIWLCRKPESSIPKGVHVVYRNSLRAYYESSTAKAWILNTRNSRLTSKRKDQIYIQTWHGPLPLKKIEKDAETKLSDAYVRSAKEDGAICDGVLVNDLIFEKIYQNAFWLNDKCELIRSGSPRSDILLNTGVHATIRKKVCDSLGLISSSYIVLYAPTFRDNKSTNGFIRDLNTVESALNKTFGNVSIVIRLHPNDIHNAKELFSSDWHNYVNATDYSDIQELVIASDCLITDYSSISYDFAIMGKPVFLCMKDFGIFQAQRGIYDHFYEQPFNLNYDEKDLINEILDYNSEEYLVRLNAFNKKYPSYNNGDASAKVVDWLLAKGLKDRRI